MSLFLRKPEPLTPGTRIAVISPSNWVEPEVLQAALKQAKDVYGLTIELHPQCNLRDGNSGGTTAEKIAAFHDVWHDPSIGAVFTARGGSRSLHMLNDLDWAMIAKHPKILLGFSDTIAIQNNVVRKSAIPAFHGIHFQQFHPAKSQDMVAHTLRFLSGEHWEEPLFPVQHPYQVLQAGEASGPLIGGNLAVVFALAAGGIDYAPRWQHKILMLEDIEEDLRYVDRMLGALRLAGVFREINGLVCGQFTNLTDTSNYPFGRTFEDMIAEHVLPDLNGPVVLNAPFGHVPLNYPFPLGIRAHLTAGTNVTLELTESPFAE